MQTSINTLEIISYQNSTHTLTYSPHSLHSRGLLHSLLLQATLTTHTSQYSNTLSLTPLTLFTLVVYYTHSYYKLHSQLTLHNTPTHSHLLSSLSSLSRSITLTPTTSYTHNSHFTILQHTLTYSPHSLHSLHSRLYFTLTYTSLSHILHSHIHLALTHTSLSHTPR